MTGVLVTGSSGRLGQALCRRLSSTHTVRGLDRVPGPLTRWVCDLSAADEASLRAALAGVQAVVHAAALHAPHVGLCTEADFERVNLTATSRLWRLAAEAGVPVFVFTSTTALHGASAAPTSGATSTTSTTSTTGATWVTEHHAPLPQSIYHRTKLAAEQALAEAACVPGAPRLRILRVGRCFPEPAQAMAVYRLHRGVDARDMAEAHALALAQAGAPRAAAVDRFIISGATPFMPGDAEALARDAASVLHTRVPALVDAFQRRGWPLPQRIDRVYDPGHAARTLGFISRHGWDEVLRQLDAGDPAVLPAAVA